MAEYSNTASRLKRAWQAVLDAYGDSVARKYDKAEMPELWKAAIASLTDHQLDQGIRRMVRAGKPHVPSLPEFMRYCREVGSPDLDEPTPMQQPLLTHGADTAGQFDKWGLRANHWLLQYIQTMAKRRVHYCDALTVKAEHSASNPSQETRDLTQPLVEFKNAWAADMREHEADGVILPASEQRTQFLECMRRAEVVVDQVRASYAQSRAA